MMDIPEEPGLRKPPEIALYRGPDSLRPNPGVDQPGMAFIYLPDGEIFYHPDGHQAILDIEKNGNQAWDILTRLWRPEELNHLGQESSIGDQPFTDWMVVRWRSQERAIFGRYGIIPGRGSVPATEAVMLWPGTKNLNQMLPGLLRTLLAERRISPEAVITVGSSAKYRVSYYLQHAGTEVGAEKPGTSGAAELRQRRELEKARGRWPYELYPEMTKVPSFAEYVRQRNDYPRAD